MYIVSNRHEVKDRTVLNWVMQGRPNRPGGPANLPLTVMVIFNHLPETPGVIVDFSCCGVLPEDIKFLKRDEIDHNYRDRMLWFARDEQVSIEFEGQVYNLFTLETVSNDEKIGTLYFHVYPPKEFGGGDLVYSVTQFLESSGPTPE